MKALVATALASKESRNTASGIASLLGGMLGAKAMSSLSTNEIIGMLRGKNTPHPLLLRVAKMVTMNKDNPEIMDFLLNSGLSWMEGKGFSTSTLLKTMKDYAPLIDLKLETVDLQGLRTSLIQLADRIVENDDTISYTAMVDCPSCRYTFLV
jgi:hypothetical protein